MYRTIRSSTTVSSLSPPLMRRLSSITHFHYCIDDILSLSILPKPTRSVAPRWARMASTISTVPYSRSQKKKNKIVVIMGPTGSGKSRLAVDLAARFFPAEIINSDKIQVYRGLDITTNKMPVGERSGVTHHLLGEFDPSESHPEFTPSDYRSTTSSVVSAIASGRKVPFVVGGSNSFIHALLAKRFNPGTDVFEESKTDSVSGELRYECCFLWVDVLLPVLNQYLSKRVDEMLDSGMFEELAEFFDSDGFSESDSVSRTGLRKAIGVPEFERYFRRFGCRTMRNCPEEDATYDEAVRAIKNNTCQLAKRQLWKIQRLRDAGWDLQKIDATDAFRAAMGLDSGRKVAEIWERQVVEPSMKIVKRFLVE